MSKKVFDGAKEAVLHATYRGLTRKALHLIYKGLVFLSKKESKKRREEEK